MKLSKERYLKLYEAMLRSRMTEEHMDRQYRMGTIRGMGHWGTGLEAIGVGTAMALRESDVMFTTHRGFGEYIGKGMSPYTIMAEHLGKSTGCSKGKGTIHLADKAKGLWGVTGVLGTDYAMVVGVALGFRRQGLDNVACKLFGEGAWQQNDFHPSMLMAVKWNAPAVYVLCMNQWIEHHHYTDVIPVKDIYKIPEAYGLNALLVEDGNDVEDVYKTVSKAAELARTGKGPSFVECRSYRMTGHFTGDAAEYMPKEELANWKKRDPILNCQKKLIAAGFLTEEEDKALRAGIEIEIADALKRVINDPEPLPEEIFTDMYAGLEVEPW